MNENIDERVNTWLRDAHAMEKQAEKMLDAQASRIENYPELKARLERHITETRSQQARLEACLDARGTSSSITKDVAAQGMAMMQGLTGAVMSDEVAKGMLASYTFEHMEIGSYRMLEAAAEAAGDPTTAQVCAEICREEEAMAAWLAEHVPEVTRTYLAREQADLPEAKR